MLVDTPTRRIFLRNVYLNGGATEADRKSWVLAWAQTAVDSLRDIGVLSSASSNSSSSGFSIPQGWGPQHVNEVCDWSFAYLGEDDVDAALELVSAKVVRFSTDFAGVRL